SCSASRNAVSSSSAVPMSQSGTPARLARSRSASKSERQVVIEIARDRRRCLFFSGRLGALPLPVAGPHGAARDHAVGNDLQAHLLGTVARLPAVELHAAGDADRIALRVLRERLRDATEREHADPLRVLGAVLVVQRY